MTVDQVKHIYVDTSGAPPAYVIDNDDDEKLLLTPSDRPVRVVNEPKGCFCVRTKILCLFILAFESTSYLMALILPVNGFESYFSTELQDRMIFHRYLWSVAFLMINALAMRGVIEENSRLIRFYIIKKAVKIFVIVCMMVLFILNWDTIFAALKKELPNDLFDEIYDAEIETNMTDSEFWRMLSNYSLGLMITIFTITVFLQCWILKTVNVHRQYLFIKEQ